MPIIMEEMTTNVTVYEGELPLTEAQIDKLVQVVMARLAEAQVQADRTREATTLRRQAAPALEIGE